MLFPIQKPNVLKRSGVHLLEVIKVWTLKYFIMVLDINIPNILCVYKAFPQTRHSLYVRINDGLEIKYLKRDRPLLVKGAIPPLLPGCLSYLSSTKTSRASRFSHEAKE